MTNVRRRRNRNVIPICDADSGWIELPDGRRVSPSVKYKFNDNKPSVLNRWVRGIL